MPQSALARRRSRCATGAVTRLSGARADRRRRCPRPALAAALLACGVAAITLSAPRPVVAQEQHEQEQHEQEQHEQARREQDRPPERQRRASPRPEAPKTTSSTSRARAARRAPSTAPAVATRRLVPIVPALVIPALPPMPPVSGELTGIVSDSDGAAIPSAEVLVVASGIVVYTDENGTFRLPPLPPGDHELRIRRIGFHPRTRVLSTKAGESWQMLVALDAAPAMLTPVGVTANVALGKMAAFERRRHGNVGLFITREQIAARKAMLLSDIMRTMPGVTMARYRSEDKVQMRPAPLGGRFDCSPDFYVDGLFVPGLDLNTIPPADVQGIELYRGPSDTPVDFRSMNAPCGVVAIWTRDPQDKRQLP